MQFYLFRHDDGTRNFGDELNTVLWPRLISADATRLLPNALFYGIGTVLGEDTQAKPASHRIVFGSGIGYHGVPSVEDNWKVYFVRGPRTANALGGVDWVTDPAILTTLLRPKAESVYRVSFMPRYDEVTDEVMQGCKHLGIHLIDPRWPVDKVLSDIISSERLLSEALHGAIVADSFGIPWVSLYGVRGHEFKWHDWCESMDMEWKPVDAAEKTLKWALDHAEPQLSRPDIRSLRMAQMFGKLSDLNRDIAERKGVFANE